ncbi:universal stress protein [Pedobacter insulae]|uniref:Nucleotide-binding universal stress protein, UspA family n=1 Tax=Pedobacter insulae TaxID=414048 RepID=A0A1I2XKP0_9SPHI|nr:universal stress protein [Pedobacter insulae]SFH12661.1 Nucleotide-binding universal stress protein, UspA family [Pedobacter insulae]
MKNPINKIIVNVDYSGSSLNAVNTAIQMCKRHRAELHLLYLVDASNFPPLEDEAGPGSTFNDQLFKEELVVFMDLADSIRTSYGVKCTLHHDTNNTSSSICEKARELDCDLIIHPVETDNRFFRYLFHSSSYRIFKQAPCSVLTVPAEKTFDCFNNILFPVRPEKDTKGKYFFSRSILIKNNANVSIIGLLEKQEPHITKTVKDMIGDARTWMNEDQLFYTSGVALNPNAAEGITSVGHDEDADLIIINGSSKRNAWEFLFGSYTQRMIENNDFAVLCFKRKKAMDIASETVDADLHFTMA